ncbi:hypothetical protein ACI0ZD_003535, partial [Cronobacter sakazakii]
RGKYNSVSMLAGEKIKFSAWLFWHYRYSRLRMEISLAKNDLLLFPGLTRLFCGLSCYFFSLLKLIGRLPDAAVFFKGMKDDYFR